MPYLHEAMFAAQAGVPLSVIDAVAVDFGMPMGPIDRSMEIGLAAAARVAAAGAGASRLAVLQT